MQRTTRLIARASAAVLIAVCACAAPAHADPEQPAQPLDPWAGLAYAVRDRAAAEQRLYSVVLAAHEAERSAHVVVEHHDSAPVDGDVFDALAGCESGSDPTTNTGNGFGGAFQFTGPTWDSMGTGYAHPWLAPYGVQKDAARRLQQRSGWGQWPSCARQLGLL